MCRMCGRNADDSVSRRFLLIRKKGREMQRTHNACTKPIVADSFSEGITFKSTGIKQFAVFFVFK